MEDIYTIKVRTKPDTRNLYPSERRYSASTVSGLAWVHIALAATSFLLACLALVSPSGTQNIKHLQLNETEQKQISNEEPIFNLNLETTTESLLDDNVTKKPVFVTENNYNNYILVSAPSLLTVFALAAGIASIMASVRWYIDHNITWLFIMSILSTTFSLISFLMVLVWFITTSDDNEDISEFYKDGPPFKDYFVVKQTDIIDRNDSHFIVARNTTNTEEVKESHLFTKRVLSINILIAAFLEFLWSILSVKISYKGMRSNYKEDDVERGGNCVSVTTVIKGNNTKKLPRNGKLIPPKPDLIDHYRNRKIKKIFLTQGEDGFYLKNQNANNKSAKQNTETSSEFYKERMMNFLNRCALEGISNSEMRTPSVQSEAVLNPIQEVINVEVNSEVALNTPEKSSRDPVTPISWGDTPEHTVYNQNNINFDDIFKFGPKSARDVKDKTDIKIDETIDNVGNNH